MTRIPSDEIPDLLYALAEKSLVHYETMPDGQTRYFALETVRQYAREQLAAEEGSDERRCRHSQYFVDFALKAWKRLGGAEQAAWLERLNEENDNLRAAFDATLDGCPDPADPTRSGQMAMAMAVALHRFWAMRGYFREGRDRYSAALAHPGSLDKTKERGDALNGAGVLAYLQGDYGEARAYFEQSLAVKREMGDEIGIAATLSNLGLVADEQGDWRGAKPFYEESLAIRRRIGDESGTAVSLLTLAFVHRASGDFSAARELGEESLTIQRKLQDLSNIAIALVNLGPMAVQLGDLEAAREYLLECAEMTLELGEVRVAAYALEAWADLARAEGRLDRAAYYFGVAERLRRETGLPLPLSSRASREKEDAELRASLGDAAFDQGFDEGAETGWREALSAILHRRIVPASHSD